MTAMPPTPQKAAMTPAELRKLIEGAGLADATKSAVATRIGCARSHLYRWLKGDSTIGEANALLIRSKLKPIAKPKKRK